MDISLCSFIFPRDWTLEQRLQATARVGASALELAVDADQLWMHRLPPKARAALRRTADDCGVAFSSLCMNAHWIFNLTSPDVRIRALGVGLLLEAIELAADLGARVILVPGCDQVESPRNRWELFRAGVMQAVTPAAEAGVTLALEAVGRPFLFDTRKLLRMIDACGSSPALGVYLDVGNSTSSGLDTPAEIRRAVGRAAMVHVKDWDPADRSRAFLGAGAVDWPAALAALKAIGYDGFLTVEHGGDRADPERVARESVQFLQRLLAA